MNQPLCEILVDGRLRAVHLGATVADEDYRAHTPAREFVPLSVSTGMRTKVIGRPYYAEVNRSTGAAPRKKRVAEAEAYFYHEDRILLLWRCRLVECARLEPSDPANDRNLAALWNGFEAFLTQHFPDSVAVVTPAWDLAYSSDRWKRFLADHGFVRPSPTGIPGMAYIRP